MSLKYYFGFLVAIPIVCLVHFASAQTTITNQAQATYKDSSGASYGPVYSNVVSVTRTSSVFSLSCTLEGTMNFTASPTLYIKTAGATTIIKTMSVALSSSGTASLSQPTELSLGTRYDFVLKVPYYLSRKISNILWPPASTMSFGAALAGNLNNSDDAINTLDWSVMNSKWRTDDAIADINKDGQVNTIDWGIMNKNWHLSGQE